MDPEATKLVVGVVGPVVAAGGLVLVAIVQSRKPARTEPASPAPAEQHEIDQQHVDNESTRVTLETFAVFRQEYDRQLEDLRRELGEVKAHVTRVTRILRILREAFRQFIRDVTRDWGKTDRPPTIDPHIRDLLLEDDLDNTFGGTDIAELREQARTSPDSAD
jgi:hypothetical protein